MCSMPSAPKMKLANALCVTTCRPAAPDWTMSTVAAAYLGALFLSPEKVRSTRIPVAVSWFGPPPLGRFSNGGAPTMSSDDVARVFEKQIGLHVGDLHLGAQRLAADSPTSAAAATAKRFIGRLPNPHRGAGLPRGRTKKAPVRRARAGARISL